MKFERLYNILCEKWVDSVKVDREDLEIFVNPSRKELNECHSRGIIDTDGNLYVVSSDYSEVIHSHILEALTKIDNKRFPDQDSSSYYGDEKDKGPIKGITVERGYNSNKFYVGESASYWFRTKHESPKTLKLIKETAKLFKKAKKKNPGLDFILKDISPDLKTDDRMDFSVYL